MYVYDKVHSGKILLNFHKGDFLSNEKTFIHFINHIALLISGSH